MNANTKVQVREERSPEASAEREVTRAAGLRTLAPRYEVHEDEQAYVLRVELPGVPREAVTLSAEARVLTLRGEGRPIDVPEGFRPMRAEFETGDFERSFRLPADVDSERIQAQMRFGVLTLRLPKRVPERRSIPVESD